MVSYLSSEILEVVPIVKEVFERHEEPVTITSGTDGPHGATSWHYSGDAIDIRANHINDEKAKVVEADLRAALAERLGSQYYAVFEDYHGSKEDNDHFHIEYDITESTDAPSRDQRID